MKSRITLILVLVLTLLLSACKQEAEETVPTQTPSSQTESAVVRSNDVLFWHPFSPQIESGRHLLKQIDEFNSSHPDSHIVSQPISSCEAILREIDERKEEGNLPGLVWICFGADSSFQNSENPVDLSAIAGSDDIQAFLSRFDPLLLDAVSYSESAAAVPFNITTPAVFYRTDLFAQNGLNPDDVSATWTNLVNAASLLTTNTETVSLTLGLDSAWMTELLIAEDGGTMLDTGTPAFNDRRFMESLDRTAALFAEGGATISDTSAQAAVALENGSVAMAVLPHEWNAEFEGDEEIGMMPWPQNDGATVPFSGGSLYILPDEEMNEQTALEFIRFLMEEERLSQFASKADILPARLSVLDSVRSSDEISTQIALNVYDQGVIRTDYGLPFLSVQEIFISTLDSIFVQSIDTDEALTEAFLKLLDQMGK